MPGEGHTGRLESGTATWSCAGHHASPTPLGDDHVTGVGQNLHLLGQMGVGDVQAVTDVPEGHRIDGLEQATDSEPQRGMDQFVEPGLNHAAPIRRGGAEHVGAAVGSDHPRQQDGHDRPGPQPQRNKAENNAEQPSVQTIAPRAPANARPPQRRNWTPVCCCTKYPMMNRTAMASGDPSPAVYPLPGWPYFRPRRTMRGRPRPPSSTSKG